MDYTKHYTALVSRAVRRVLNYYTEKHHIIPKCLGGSDHQDNLVSLTPEEHYIAHLLLLRIYPGNVSLIYAANMMANRNNKSFGVFKRAFKDVARTDMLARWQDPLMRAKMLDRRPPGPHSDYHCKAISNGLCKRLEYKGRVYIGYEALKDQTKVTKELYKKYYLNGIDPEPFIGAKGRVFGYPHKSEEELRTLRQSRSRNVKGRFWYNNGTKDRMFLETKVPSNDWKRGRLIKPSGWVGKRGSESHSSKPFLITDPHGTQYSVIGLSDWARKNYEKFGVSLEKLLTALETRLSVGKPGTRGLLKGWDIQRV